MRFFFEAGAESVPWESLCDLDSSFSDSLIVPRSLFPSTLPLMELAALCETMEIGVWGGVVAGRFEFVAVTEGTAPIVGVGLLTTLEDVVPANEIVEPAGLEGMIGLDEFMGAGVGFGKAGDVEMVEGAGMGADVACVGPVTI